MAKELDADEIKRVRSFYGLSQRSFATLLGIGPASMMRYENGTSPTKSNANLIRAARNPLFLLECLENEGANIPKSQRTRAEIIARKEVGNSASASMDELFAYTLLQETLNAQAANLLANIATHELARGKHLSADNVQETLFQQLAILKPSIIDSQSRDFVRLAEVQGFLKCASKILHNSKTEVA